MERINHAKWAELLGAHRNTIMNWYDQKFRTTSVDYMIKLLIILEAFEERDFKRIP